MNHLHQHKWIGRALIGLVFFFNVQCALAFLIAPQAFAPGFELEGPVGAGMVRGMGLLFLMWNIPYAFALVDPVKQRVSVYEAVAMQAVGFLGETLLLLTFEPGHATLRSTMLRFIAFDGGGLAALLLAARLTRPVLPRQGVSAGSPAQKS